MVRGTEIAVGSGERPVLIFSLDNPTVSKIFFIHILELCAHLGFYIRDLSSRGTAYRFSFFSTRTNFLFTALPLRPAPLVLFAYSAGLAEQLARAKQPFS